MLVGLVEVAVLGLAEFLLVALEPCNALLRPLGVEVRAFQVLAGRIDACHQLCDARNDPERLARHQVLQLLLCGLVEVAQALVVRVVGQEVGAVQVAKVLQVGHVVPQILKMLFVVVDEPRLAAQLLHEPHRTPVFIADVPERVHGKVEHRHAGDAAALAQLDQVFGVVVALRGHLKGLIRRRWVLLPHLFLGAREVGIHGRHVPRALPGVDLAVHLLLNALEILVLLA